LRKVKDEMIILGTQQGKEYELINGEQMYFVKKGYFDDDEGEVPKHFELDDGPDISRI
jgi:hypothetical protein